MIDPTFAAQRQDLNSRAQIHDLVVSFYREIVFDEMLEPVFGEVAEVDWALHIPKLIDYWCRVILRQPGYNGYILEAHQHVHDLKPLEVEHFDRWYGLWVETIDARWAGPLVDLTKEHAMRMGGTLARRLMDVTWPPSGERVERFSADNEP
jgi:hemoglobin